MRGAFTPFPHPRHDPPPPVAQPDSLRESLRVPALENAGFLPPQAAGGGAEAGPEPSLAPPRDAAGGDVGGDAGSAGAGEPGEPCGRRGNRGAGAR